MILVTLKAKVEEDWQKFLNFLGKVALDLNPALALFESKYQHNSNSY